MKNKKQGITTLEFCGREINLLRGLVHSALMATKGGRKGDRKENLLRAYLKRLSFKLNGSYRCPHCKSWVQK